MKQDNAFTGLEAAIVLIAFVVVAAVFSYVLLGAGFFATQKAQEVTYAGIKQTVSNVVVDGSIYANISSSKLGGFTFNVRIPLGGEAVDMSTTTFLYSSSKNTTPITMDGTSYNGNTGPDADLEYPDQDEGKVMYHVYYPIDDEFGAYGDSPGNSILTSGSFATYMVSIPTDGELGAKEWFTLEMRPRIGAATIITKTIAAGINAGEVI